MADSNMHPSGIIDAMEPGQIRHVWSQDVFGRPPPTPYLRPAVDIVYLSPEAEATAAAEAVQARNVLQAIPRASPVLGHATVLETLQSTDPLNLAGLTKPRDVPILRRPGPLIRQIRRGIPALLRNNKPDHGRLFRIRKGTPSEVSRTHSGDLKPSHLQRTRLFADTTAASTLDSKRNVLRYNLFHHSGGQLCQKVRAIMMPLPGAKDRQWRTPVAATTEQAAKTAYRKYLRDRNSRLSKMMTMSDVEALEAVWDPCVE